MHCPTDNRSVIMQIMRSKQEAHSSPESDSAFDMGKLMGSPFEGPARWWWREERAPLRPRRAERNKEKLLIQRSIRIYRLKDKYGRT